MQSLKATRESVYNFFNKKFRHGWTSSQIKNFYTEAAQGTDSKPILEIDKYFNIDCKLLDLLELIEDNKFTLDKFINKIYQLQERMEEKKLKEAQEKGDNAKMREAEDDGYINFIQT